MHELIFNNKYILPYNFGFLFYFLCLSYSLNISPLFLYRNYLFWQFFFTWLVISSRSLSFFLIFSHKYVIKSVADCKCKCMCVCVSTIKTLFNSDTQHSLLLPLCICLCLCVIFLFVRIANSISLLIKVIIAIVGVVAFMH